MKWRLALFHEYRDACHIIEVLAAIFYHASTWNIMRQLGASIEIWWAVASLMQWRNLARRSCNGTSSWTWMPSRQHKLFIAMNGKIYSASHYDDASSCIGSISIVSAWRTSGQAGNAIMSEEYCSEPLRRTYSLISRYNRVDSTKRRRYYLAKAKIFENETR